MATRCKTFLLPVTHRALPFAASLLRATAEKAAVSVGGAPPLQFRVAATSREHERALRSLFPQLLAGHADEPVANWTRPEDVTEALGGCDGVILAASGSGGDVFAVQDAAMSEWIDCERRIACSIPKDCEVLKLSWASGLVGERAPTAAGRAHWEIEQELVAAVGDAAKLRVVRAPTGMDAFLQGRLFDLICGRTLSTSVKRGRVALVHPLDVAESLSALLLQAAKREGVAESPDVGVFTLTGPEALSFQEIAAQLSEGIGEQVRYSHFPQWAVQPARWIQGVPGDAIEEELAVVRALEGGAQQEVDTTLMETLLGHKPRSFREFIAENAKAWPRASSS
ncbi:hypothetical protein BBJ28_00009326 [Nothophytophthora sp. Chile5]|nr:hypothetical protein BBJ28_00009326 [Nothophytophthora sp. Chile5]